MMESIKPIAEAVVDHQQAARPDDPRNYALLMWTILPPECQTLLAQLVYEGPLWAGAYSGNKDAMQVLLYYNLALPCVYQGQGGYVIGSPLALTVCTAGDAKDPRPKDEGLPKTFTTD